MRSLISPGSMENRGDWLWGWELKGDMEARAGRFSRERDLRSSLGLLAISSTTFDTFSGAL